MIGISSHGAHGEGIAQGTRGYTGKVSHGAHGGHGETTEEASRKASHRTRGKTKRNLITEDTENSEEGPNKKPHVKTPRLQGKTKINKPQRPHEGHKEGIAQSTRGSRGNNRRSLTQSLAQDAGGR